MCVKLGVKKLVCLCLAASILSAGCFQFIKKHGPEPLGSGLDHRGRQSDTLDVNVFTAKDALDSLKSHPNANNTKSIAPNGVEIKQAVVAGDSFRITTKKEELITVALADLIFDYAFGVDKHPILSVRSHTPRIQYVIFCHDEDQKAKYFPTLNQ